MSITNLALAAGAIGFLTGSSAPIAFIPENVDKIPGAKTFGKPAALGAACLAINYFRPNKWLKLAGWAGVAVAAVQLGQSGAGFKFLGDDDMGTLDMDDGMGDVEGDE